MSEINPLGEIRSMKQDDVVEVLAIELQVHPFPWTEQIFRDCIIVGYACKVIEHEQKIIAFAVVTSSAGESHILNITVQPDQQGKGLGRRMMQHLLLEAEQNEIEQMILEVRASNEVAQKLYASLGFDVLSTRKEYYPCESGREDAIVLVKKIK